MLRSRTLGVVLAIVSCTAIIGCSGNKPAMTHNDEIHATAAAKSAPVSREQVILWSLHGMSDQTIIARVQRHGCSDRLTSAEQIHLQDAGVSDDVIQAMKAVNN